MVLSQKCKLCIESVIGFIFYSTSIKLVSLEILVHCKCAKMRHCSSRTKSRREAVNAIRRNAFTAFKASNWYRITKRDARIIMNPRVCNRAPARVIRRLGNIQCGKTSSSVHKMFDDTRSPLRLSTLRCYGNKRAAEINLSCPRSGHRYNGACICHYLEKLAVALIELLYYKVIMREACML